MSLFSQPYASSPWLAVSPSDVSAPNPSAGLLVSSLSRRSYCLIASPWDSLTSSPFTLYLSSDSYASGSLDTLQDGLTSLPHQLFRARLLSGSVFNVESRVMSAGQLVQSPAPSFGVTKVILADDDPDILYHLSLWWKNAPIAMYVGDPDWPFQRFIQFARSTVAQITRDDSMTYSISWGSAATLLQKDIQPRKYRGMGGALRFNPATSPKVQGTLLCPAGAMTVECWLRVGASFATIARILCWRSGSSAGTRSLDIGNAGANLPRFAIRNDAGTLIEANGPTPILITSNLQYGTHIAGVVDPLARVIRLVINGVTVTSTPLTGTVATTLSTLYWAVNDASTERMDNSDIDEVRVWSVARSDTDIQSTMNGEISPTTPNLFAYYKCNDQAPGNVTVFDSCIGAHNLTLTNAIWIGSLTGGPSVAGKPLPTLEGPYQKFEPVPVDDINGVWQLNHGSMVSIDILEHRGQQVYIYDSDVADITSVSPASGHWSSCLAQGIFKLNAVITGKLLATGRGDNQTINGIGYVDDIASIVRKKALLAGMTDSQIDLASIGYISGTYPYKVWDGTQLTPQSVDSAIVEMMGWIMGWRITTRDGRLSLGALAVPPSIKWIFDETNVAIDTCTVVAFSPPSKQTILGYSRYGQTQSAGELSTSNLEIVSDLGQEYRTTQTPVNSAVMVADASALPRTLNTAIVGLADASAEALRQQDFWAQAPVTIRCQTTDGEFQYAIGDGLQLAVSDESLLSGSALGIPGLRGVFTGMIVAIGDTVPLVGWFEAIGVVTLRTLVTTDGGGLDIGTTEGSGIDVL